MIKFVICLTAVSGVSAQQDPAVDCNYDTTMTGDECTPGIQEMTEYPWCGHWGRVPCHAYADYESGCDELCLGARFGLDVGIALNQKRKTYYFTRGHSGTPQADIAHLSDTMHPDTAEGLPDMGDEVCNATEFEILDDLMPTYHQCASWYICGHPTEDTVKVLQGDEYTYPPQPQWNALTCYAEMSFLEFETSEFFGGYECTAEKPCPISMHRRAAGTLGCGACLAIATTAHEGLARTDVQYARVVTYHGDEEQPNDPIITSNCDVTILHPSVHYHTCHDDADARIPGHGVTSHYWQIYTESGDCVTTHEFIGCNFQNTITPTPCDPAVSFTENTDCTEESPCSMASMLEEECGERVVNGDNVYVVTHTYASPTSGMPRYLVDKSVWDASTDVECSDDVLLPFVPTTTSSGGAFHAALTMLAIMALI